MGKEEKIKEEIKKYYDIKDPNSFTRQLLKAIEMQCFINTIKEADKFNSKDRNNRSNSFNNRILADFIKTGYRYYLLLTIRKLIDKRKDSYSLKNLIKLVEENNLIKPKKLDEIKNQFGFDRITKLRTIAHKKIAHNGNDSHNYKNETFKETEEALIIIAEISFKLYLEIFDCHQSFNLIREPDFFKHLDEPFFNQESIQKLSKYFEHEQERIAQEIEKSNL